MENSRQSSEQDRDREENTMADRDLGTVGGGPIPAKGGRTTGGMNTSDTTVDSGSGAPDDRTIQSSSGTHDSEDQPQQGTLGGRNPGQPSNTVGDRDKTFGHRDLDDTAIDPMTSRTPDKIKAVQSNEKPEQHQQEG